MIRKGQTNLIYCFSSLYKLAPIIWRVHIYWKSFWYTLNEIIYWNQWWVLFYFKYCVHDFLPVDREAATLESLIIAPLVIKVPQSNGGVKIVLYDFLTAMSLAKINSLLHFSTLFHCSSSNFWIIGNSTAKKVRTARDFGGFFSIVHVLLLKIRE